MPFKNEADRIAHRKAYYAKHRDKAKAYSAKWKRENRDRVNYLARVSNAERMRKDQDFRERRRRFARESYRKFTAKRLLLAAKHRGTERSHARQILRNAIRRGEVIRPSQCDACGVPDGIHNRIQAHHSDYSKPLSVIWLCSLCHGAIHRAERRLDRVR